jgi:ferrous iron transport protein A
MKNNMKQKLSDLLPGEEAIIVKVNCGAELGKRLVDMGLTEGRKVLMRRSAPFGGSMEIDIGYNLALRKSEADYVVVKELEENNYEK